MTVETILVNGVDLNSRATFLQEISGLYITPKRREQNLILPGRHGTLQVPRKRYEAGTLIIKLWVDGVDKTTGVVPGGSTSEAQFRARVDELAALFYSETLTIDHVMPDGSIRRAIGELTQDPISFAPTVDSLVRYGEFSVAITLPGAFWLDTTAQTSGPWLLTTGSTQALSEFAAATAPMTDLTLTFGPGANPLLSQPSTGVFVAWDSVIASGRKLALDTKTWTLTGTIDAGGTWAVDYTKLRHGGDPGYPFALYPNGDGTAPVVQLTHTAGGSMSVTAAGPRKYMNA